VKLLKIEAIEVWLQGVRAGYIVENWFYPAANIQLSTEELNKIAAVIQSGEGP
jgi:hypothetical protein